MKGSKGYTTKSPLLAIRSLHLCPRFRVRAQADTRKVCWILDSDELEARPGAGPDGPLDIQDAIGVTESERELGN